MLDNLLGMMPRLLDGLWTTLGLLILSATAGLCLGVLMALAGISKYRLLKLISQVYRTIFRSVPGLVVLYFVYYGIAQLEIVRESPLWMIFKHPYWCAWLALTVNDGAFTSELLYGSLKSVPKGYQQAGAALGMSPTKTLWLIQMPIALRLVFPAYTTEIIFLTKATSIVSTITMLDLMGTADLLYKETFDPFLPLVSAGLIYTLLIWLITRLSALIESSAFRYPNIQT